MCQQGINFVDYIWSFGDYRPAEGMNRSEEQVPTSTAVSSPISGCLKRQGVKFVGLTIFYAFMQACGLVNNHLIGCHRYIFRQLERR